MDNFKDFSKDFDTYNNLIKNKNFQKQEIFDLPNLDYQSDGSTIEA